MSGAMAGGKLAAPARRGLPAKFLGFSGLGLAALLGAAVLGYQYWTVGQYFERTDDAYVGGDVTDLAPQVSGLIARVAIRDNQAVHAGDLLVQIDDRDFLVAVRKAQAELAGAQANLANLAAQERLQRAMIAQAQANLVSAQAAIVLARENQGRYARLAVSQAGTVQDAQTAQTNLAQAMAAGEHAAAGLLAAQAQLAVLDTQILQAQAQYSGAQADLAGAELNLGYTQIRAPVDGVIGNRSAHLGGYANAGAQLVSIVPLSGLWVDANFKEDQLARMQPGERVTIQADVLPDAKITGVVASLAPASGAVFSILPAENATGNFTKIVQRVPVRILLNGDAAQLGLLRPGLSVTATVDTRP